MPSLTTVTLSSAFRYKNNVASNCENGMERIDD